MDPDEAKTKNLRDRTKQFAIRIIRLYGSLPLRTDVQVVGKQLLRSGTSVAANYREAGRARSKIEFTSKAQIALQEADETQFWIECLKEGCLISNPELDALWQESDELVRILTTICIRAKQPPPI
jgi:four helix bundle protein